MEIKLSVRDNYLKSSEQIVDCFYYFLKKINRINNKIIALYAKSEDLDEAMSHKFVDVTGKRYEDNFHLIDEYSGSEGAWSGDLKNSASVSLFSKDIQTIFTLRFDSELLSSELYSEIKKMFLELNSDFELIFFNVSYPSANVVYPDRPSTSWMLFIKDTNFSEAKIDQAEVIEDIEKGGVKIGELLITTKNYDPKNIHHQNRSNDIDILLLGYHLLPKYKEIYIK
ncbi:immunity 52 family protein [Providencia stuartii]|uniref:immunity 52 family protein n=1 Tax=Providencia stuartii TaxID=588 RepID=UPI00112003DA|nr:immunity 52 family protein [Providencia stuartii]